MSPNLRLASAMRSVVTRGQVISSEVGPRTLLQVDVLNGETFDQVELLLPPGYVARPADGHDVLVLQANGTRDHKVALGGDLVGETVADLAQGEYGLRGNGRQIILRTGGIEIVGDGEPLRRLVTEIFMQLFNEHTHPTPSGQSSPPSQQMTTAHLTATTQMGGAS